MHDPKLDLRRFALKYFALRHPALRCLALRHSALRHSALRHSALRYSVLWKTGLAVVLCSPLSAGLLLDCLTLEALATLAQENSSMTGNRREEIAEETETAKTETVETETVETETVRIVLRLSDRQVFLYEGETIVESYPVAVGAADTPTPQGEFEVSKLVIEPVWQSPWTGEMHPPGPNSALGLRWIGFFTDESGAFGFHGTPTLNSIGKAVSNGCVRMRNEDIVALFSQVKIGTPVLVMP